jgi:hypothetical protein
MMGIEPTNGGITIHCLNHLATLAIDISDFTIARRQTAKKISFPSLFLRQRDLFPIIAHTDSQI